MSGYHGAVRKEIFPFLPASCDALLDVGGGYGNTAAAAKDRMRARRAVVIDAVAEAGAVNPGVDHAAKADLDDIASLADICSREGPFSVILCLDVLEHLKDPWSCVRELERHLAPGGVVVASIPNVAHASVSVRLFALGQWRLQDDGILDRTHLRFFTRETARELMECGGLVVDKVHPLLSGHAPFRQLHVLAPLIGERWFAFGYVMVARRRSDQESAETVRNGGVAQLGER